MGLLQEWYMQEAADSEEENFHRPLSDEQLFFHAVRSGDIDFVRENWCRHAFPRPGNQFEIPFCGYDGICDIP